MHKRKSISHVSNTIISLLNFVRYVILDLLAATRWSQTKIKSQHPWLCIMELGAKTIVTINNAHVYA